MANPFTRPIAYKYKPLGFEAFATPLARKQAAYDQAISAYDDMSFDLPELPGDEKQVKAIESKLTNNLTDLRDQLTGTKDYRTAISKLKQLNKYYTSSDETQSYRSNYDSFQKWKEERRKLVEKGDLSEEDYQQEVAVTLGEFANKGGTNYDPKTGDYNSINLVRSPHNMDKEIQEWALKYAKADKANKEVMIDLANLSADEESKIRAIKQTLKYNTPQEIASAVQSALMSSDRFKEYLESKADLNYRHQKLKDGNWSPNLKERRLKDYDDNINKYQNIVTEYINAATDDEKKAVADKHGISEADASAILSKLSDKKSEFSTTYDSNPEATERSLYGDYFYQDRMQSESSAMGDLLGFTEEDIFGLGGSGGLGSGSGGSGGVRFGSTKADDPLLTRTEYMPVSTGAAQERTIVEQREKAMDTKKAAFDDVFGTNLTETAGVANINNTRVGEEINQIGAQLLQTIYGVVDPNETDLMKRIITSSAFVPENINSNLNSLMENTEAGTQKIKNILNAFQSQVTQDINDEKKFAEDLREYGINVTDENAKVLLNSLNEADVNGELSSFGESLDALNSVNRQLKTIETRRKAAAETYASDKGKVNDVLNVLDPGGEDWEDQSFISKKSGTIDGNYYISGASWKNTIFDPTMYANSEERKIMEDMADAQDRVRYKLTSIKPLTLDEVAVKAGYKNANDAIKDGFNFTAKQMPKGIFWKGTVKETVYHSPTAATGMEVETVYDEDNLPGTIRINMNDDLKASLGMKDVPGWWETRWNNLKKSYIPGEARAAMTGDGTYNIGEVIQMHKDWQIEQDSSQFEDNLMGYEYSGNTNLTDALVGTIGTVDKLTRFNLAFQTGWDDVPGFTTEAGESGALPGTKFTSNSKPRISFVGDEMVIGIPYSYDDDGTERASTVYVDFNTDAISNSDKEDMIDAILIDAQKIKDKGGNVAPYVFDLGQQARFNARYPDNGISTTYSNTLPLNKGEEVVMDEMPMVGQKGQDGYMSLEIVKRQVSTDKSDYVLRRRSGSDSLEDGYITYGEGEKAEGEIISFETPEAVKQYLSYQFLDQLGIRDLGFNPNVSIGSGKASTREKYITEETTDPTDPYGDYDPYGGYDRTQGLEILE